MFSAANDNKTFREIIRAGALVGLGWAVEFAILELIASSSATLQAATAVIGTAAILAITFQFWLDRKSHRLFWSILATLLLIYCGVLGYAISEAVTAHQYRNHLRQMYVESEILLRRDVPPDNKNPSAFDAVALQKWHSESDAWETGSSIWLQQHLSGAAAVRFNDMSAMPNQCWMPRGQLICRDPYVTQFLNHVSAHRTNLAAIMEHFSDYYP